MSNELDIPRLPPQLLPHYLQCRLRYRFLFLFRFPLFLHPSSSLLLFSLLLLSSPRFAFPPSKAIIGPLLLVDIRSEDVCSRVSVEAPIAGSLGIFQSPSYVTPVTSFLIGSTVFLQARIDSSGVSLSSLNLSRLLIVDGYNSTYLYSETASPSTPIVSGANFSITRQDRSILECQFSLTPDIVGVLGTTKYLTLLASLRVEYGFISKKRSAFSELSELSELGGEFGTMALGEQRERLVPLVAGFTAYRRSSPSFSAVLIPSFFSLLLLLLAIFISHSDICH